MLADIDSSVNYDRSMLYMRVDNLSEVRIGHTFAVHSRYHGWSEVMCESVSRTQCVMSNGQKYRKKDARRIGGSSGWYGGDFDLHVMDDSIRAMMRRAQVEKRVQIKLDKMRLSEMTLDQLDIIERSLDEINIHLERYYMEVDLVMDGWTFYEEPQTIELRVRADKVFVASPVRVALWVKSDYLVLNYLVTAVHHDNNQYCTVYMRRYYP